MTTLSSRLAARAALPAGAIVLVVVGALACTSSDTTSDAERAAASAGDVALAPNVVRAHLQIEGMTCGSCATTARLALDRSAGVREADVSYEQASGVVWYDSTVTAPDRFIADLARMTGYQARVVEQPVPAGPGS